MKITYLGQAGLLFEKDEFKIMVDPYLSNSVVKVNPNNYRRQPINESLFDLRPDVMIFTHDHLDHYDPETAEVYLKKYSNMTILSPTSVYQKAVKLGNFNNYICFNRYTRWTQNGITFTSIRAEHSDPCAIGVIIDDGEKKYYITGDTLYNEDIFNDIPNDIDVLFLPINGLGNNMNMIDAQDFAKKVNPKIVVPFHVGMFDEMTADEFQANNKIIPEIYKEIKL